MAAEGRVVAFRGKYGFLSNFEASEREGKPFSVERYYQAFKAQAAGRWELAEEILKTPSPAKCKRLGRGLPRPSNALPYMEDLVKEKFRDPHFQRLLLETGEMELEEGNAWGDDFWGMVPGVGGFRGENHLGRILMRVRGMVRRGEL